MPLWLSERVNEGCLAVSFEIVILVVPSALHFHAETVGLAEVVLLTDILCWAQKLLAPKLKVGTGLAFTTIVLSILSVQPEPLEMRNFTV